VPNKRIIKISENKIYISPEYYFSIEETNLPKEYFAFKAKEDFYWEVSARFNKDTKELLATVTDYFPAECSGFDGQQVKADISLLCFEKFEWAYLQPFLFMYRKKDLLEYLLPTKIRQIKTLKIFCF
jgi:hypothetical protein